MVKLPINFLISDTLSGIPGLRSQTRRDEIVENLGITECGGRRGNYNPGVARGGESKSVEAQQEEARDTSRKARRRLTAEEATAAREKENLRLARERVVQQMEHSSNPRHRKLMQDALADLDEKLQKFQG